MLNVDSQHLRSRPGSECGSQLEESLVSKLVTNRQRLTGYLYSEESDADHKHNANPGGVLH